MKIIKKYEGDNNNFTSSSDDEDDFMDYETYNDNKSVNINNRKDSISEYNSDVKLVKQI